MVNGAYDGPLRERVALEVGQPVYLRATVDTCMLRFAYSMDGEAWTTVGPALDFSCLSDEACREGVFTGAFVGVCVQDLAGARLHADFNFFEYREATE